MACLVGYPNRNPSAFGRSWVSAKGISSGCRVAVVGAVSHTLVGAFDTSAAKAPYLRWEMHLVSDVLRKGLLYLPGKQS